MIVDLIRFAVRLLVTCLACNIRSSESKTWLALAIGLFHVRVEPRKYIKRLTVTHKQTTFNTLHQTWTLSSSKVFPLVYRVRLTDADHALLLYRAVVGT